MPELSWAAPGAVESALLTAVGAFAGLTGSILGVGGGVIVVPVLAVAFGAPMRVAVAASLVGVAATSAASAGSYLKQGRVDVPLGLELEVATATGAVAASLLAPFVPEGWLYLAFTAAVLYAAWGMLRRRSRDGTDGASGGGGRERTRRGWGTLTMGGAGMASGLLGIGGGFAKVPVMHALMGVRLPVATATSTFMIGMTAASSGWVYWARGDLSLALAAPVALGVLAGSAAGARLSRRIPNRWLRFLFVGLLLYIAAQMLWRGLARL